ncbi:hypothetical protein ACXO64_04650 [Lactobacillus delbrueckii subsp. bulgaricus]|nr:hypothetical protein [Lactobacillus delbrueckii]NRD06443.1 hypothetical protein [Lactobacillus delbrueckii subsp. bulgaricus]
MVSVSHAGVILVTGVREVVGDRVVGVSLAAAGRAGRQDADDFVVISD